MPSIGSLDQLAQYLTHDFWAYHGTGWHSFNTGVPTGPTVIEVDVTGLTTAGQALAWAAMETWEAVADIQFRSAVGPITSGITFDDTQPGGYASSDGGLSSNLTTNAFINISTDITAGGAPLNSYAFFVFVHEIGHALGLGHQGPYNGVADYATDAVFENDSMSMSIMSYFWTGGFNPTDPATFAWTMSPMLADVIAIQSLYGAPQGGSTAGNTAWGRGMSADTVLGRFFAAVSGDAPDTSLFGLDPFALTIYDEGGHDCLDLSFGNLDQVLDLRGGFHSDWNGGLRNLAIARGTLIEDCVAGAGHDRVTGNSGNNHLRGQGGRDVLVGGAGHDLLNGGGDADTLMGSGGRDHLEGGSGVDLLQGGDAADALHGGAGADILFGDNGSDRLEGGALEDRLDGGLGSDKLLGGLGADQFVFSNGMGRDSVLDFRNDVDTLLLDDALWGGGQTLRQVLNGAKLISGRLVITWGDDQLTLAGVTRTSDLMNDVTFI